MNFSLSVWLKQYRIPVGGALLAIALTAYSAPSIASSPPLAPESPTRSTTDTAEQSQKEAVRVIRDYYKAIDRRTYEKAYLAWENNGAASHQLFEQFKQGFANTATTAVEVGEPGRIDAGAGSLYIEIPVTVTSTTTSGVSQRFSGSYVLRRVNDVVGSTPEQRRWHLYSATLTQTP